MKMAEQHRFQVFPPGFGLRVAKKAAATGVQQKNGFAVVPQQVGCRGPVWRQFRAARTQYLGVSVCGGAGSMPFVLFPSGGLAAQALSAIRTIAIRPQAVETRRSAGWRGNGLMRCSCVVAVVARLWPAAGRIQHK